MAYLNSLACILNIIIAIYVYLKATRSKINRLFFLVALIIGIWCFVNIIYVTSLIYPWVNGSYAIGIFLPFIILVWVSYFVSRPLHNSLIYILLLITSILAILSLVPDLLIKQNAKALTFGFEVLPGPYFIWYSIFATGSLLYALFLFFKNRKEVFGLKRVQYNYVFLGFAVPIILIIIFDFFLPFFGIFSLASLDSPMSLVFVAIIAYSITRYRFMDIKVVIRKGIIYAFSLIIALALYTYLALILKSTIEKSWNISPAWTAFILVGLVAIGFPPLKSLVEKLINAVFRGKQSIDLAVKEVQEKIAKRKDLEALIDLVSEEIKKYLEIKDAKIYIIDRKEQQFVYSNTEEERESLSLSSDLVRYFEKYPDALVWDEIEHLVEEQQGKFEKEILHKAEKEMKKHKFTLALPLKTEDEIFGIIALGERQNSQTYTVQDVQYLEQLREQVNFTLANAVLYRDTIERVRQTYGEYTID